MQTRHKHASPRQTAAVISNLIEVLTQSGLNAVDVTTLRRIVEACEETERR